MSLHLPSPSFFPSFLLTLAQDDREDMVAWYRGVYAARGFELPHVDLEEDEEGMAMMDAIEEEDEEEGADSHQE